MQVLVLGAELRSSLLHRLLAAQVKLRNTVQCGVRATDVGACAAVCWRAWRNSTCASGTSLRSSCIAASARSLLRLRRRARRCVSWARHSAPRPRAQAAHGTERERHARRHAAVRGASRARQARRQASVGGNGARAPAQHHRCALFRQPLGRFQAQAAVGARHQRRLAAQVGRAAWVPRLAALRAHRRRKSDGAGRAEV